MIRRYIVMKIQMEIRNDKKIQHDEDTDGDTWWYINRTIVTRERLWEKVDLSGHLAILSMHLFLRLIHENSSVLHITELLQLSFSVWRKKKKIQFGNKNQKRKIQFGNKNRKRKIINKILFHSMWRETDVMIHFSACKTIMILGWEHYRLWGV